MKKVMIAVILALVALTGCVNKIAVKCPSCMITGSEGSVSYECTDCTIDASGTEDFSFIQIPSRD